MKYILILLLTFCVAAGFAATAAEPASAAPPKAKASYIINMDKVYEFAREEAGSKCRAVAAWKTWQIPTHPLPISEMRCEGVSAPYPASAGERADCFRQGLGKVSSRYAYCRLAFFAEHARYGEFVGVRSFRRYRQNVEGDIVPIKRKTTDWKYHWTKDEAAMARVSEEGVAWFGWNKLGVQGTATRNARSECAADARELNKSATDWYPYTCNLGKAVGDSCFPDDRPWKANQGTCWLHWRIRDDTQQNPRYRRCARRQGYRMTSDWQAKKIREGTVNFPVCRWGKRVPLGHGG